MAEHPQNGSGRDDHEVAATAPVSLAHIPTASELRTELSQRTDDILSSPRPVADPLSAEREKAVVHECRYLMRLLSIRRRSAGEMRQRLEKREVPADIAHEAMARIDRAGLIDDAVFAREWVQQRREIRALGDEALRRELHKRLVSSALIDAALSTGESDEESRCRELVRSRIGYRDREQLSTERDGAHRRRLSRRLDALLTRKGYPGSLAVHVISGELREAASSAES